MPIFFLHIRDGAVFVEDTEGQEFASVEGARDEAVHAAREMLAEKIRQGEVVDGQIIEIWDASGAVAATVRLKDQIRFAGHPTGS